MAINKKTKEQKIPYKKIYIRVCLILIIYLIILFLSQFFINLVYSDIKSKIYTESIIAVTPFLDDFVTAQFSCQGNSTKVNFIVKDEFENIRHNSSSTINCNTFTKVSLQGSPLDYTKDRKYIVYATFNNQTINSGYFIFTKNTFPEIIKREVYSFIAFMISQNKLARGTYSDRQRLLFLDTGDEKYARATFQANVIGVLYAFTIILGIDIILWLIYWITQIVKKSNKK